MQAALVTPPHCTHISLVALTALLCPQVPSSHFCCHVPPPPGPLVWDLSSSDDLDTFEECWLVILQTVPLFGFVWGSCHDWAGVLGLGRARQGRAPVH